jgi:hypothetical protein
MRMAHNGAPGRRKCTGDWKIAVIAKYLREERGWNEPWEQLIGISWDEVERMRGPELDPNGYYPRYPLIERRLTASDCLRIVGDAGLPPPPKSACWFCPFHSLADWSRMRLHRPDLFARAADLERQVSERRLALGLARGDALYLTNRLKPLDIAIPEGAEQIGMFDNTEGHCTSGYCWT